MTEHVELSAAQIAAALAQGERVREQARRIPYVVYRYDRSSQLNAADPGPDGVYRITTLEERP